MNRPTRGSHVVITFWILQHIPIIFWSHQINATANRMARTVVLPSVAEVAKQSIEFCQSIAAAFWSLSKFICRLSTIESSSFDRIFWIHLPMWIGGSRVGDPWLNLWVSHFRFLHSPSAMSLMFKEGLDPCRQALNPNSDFVSAMYTGTIPGVISVSLFVL